MRAVFAMSALLAFAAAPVLAHHGWGSYDAQNPVTLEGALTKVEYANPHVHVELASEGKAWEATLAPPFRMNARGISNVGLKTGMKVKLFGYPSREKQNEMRAEWIEVGDKRTQLR